VSSTPPAVRESKVALTIFAHDHVVSESISAAVPAAPDQSVSSQVGGTGTGPEVVIASQDRDVSFARPEAKGPTPSKTGTSIRHLELPEPYHASPPVRDHAIAGGSSVSPIDPREGPAPAVAPAPEVAAASDSAATISPGTLVIRVEVDGTGKVVNAVLIPQRDLDPAFAEAALAMARNWRFEASPDDNQPAIHILEFRQPANR
jgi:TonB family protein